MGWRHASVPPLLVRQLLEKDKPQHIFACISAYPHIHTRTLITEFNIPLYQIRFVRPLSSLKAVALVKIHYDNNEV